MEFEEVVKGRRSIRGYKPDPVPRAVIEEVIELADLAEIVGLSKSQFQREFNRLFGRSVLTYILEVRTSIARRMLESSQMKLLEIANQCGFYDQSHFSRQFKRSTGLRPMEYRKRYTSD